MTRYAAIDIGSNSIRMQTAEVVPGAMPRILAADREVARLGESVFKNGAVAEQSIQFACDVLGRMARKYQSLDVAGVRAVATASIRDARNQAEFLERASAAAGTPVEVISGREEARLIHLGVLSRWPDAGPDLFIIDIGGGSAEIMASHRGQLRHALSKPLGAIRLRELFLANDPPAPTELEQLHAYIDEKLETESERFHGAQYTRAIATSATAAAIVSAAQRIPRADRDEADRRRASTAQVRRIFKTLSSMNADQRRKVPGIGPRRAQIIIPGAAVLLRALELFGLPAVYYSAAGVRDGIIADLDARGIGRELSRLKPDERKDVERMTVHYGVARAHARQVAAFATELFDALHPVHALAPGYGRALEASALLHDIGHFIADSSHHKHSHYIVANSDMPGFTARERLLIANLCRYHRKALPSADHTNLSVLTPDDRKALLRLIPLLRLADALDRSHAQHVATVACAVKDSQVLLDLESKLDVGLEKWASERVAPLFQEVYGYALRVRAPRAPVVPAHAPTRRRTSSARR